MPLESYAQVAAHMSNSPAVLACTCYLTRRVACPNGCTTLAGALASAPLAVTRGVCLSSLPKSHPSLGFARREARLAGEKEEDGGAIEAALCSSLKEQRMLRAVRL